MSIKKYILNQKPNWTLDLIAAGFAAIALALVLCGIPTWASYTVLGAGLASVGLCALWYWQAGVRARLLHVVTVTVFMVLIGFILANIAHYLNQYYPGSGGLIF